MDIARALQKAVGRLAGTTDDDYDDYDENDNETDAEREEHARCLRGAGGSQFDHIYDQQSAGQRRSSPETDRRTLALVRVERSEFAYLAPQSFAGARQIADRFRDDASVIVDLESCEAALAGRGDRLLQRPGLRSGGQSAVHRRTGSSTDAGPRRALG